MNRIYVSGFIVRNIKPNSTFKVGVTQLAVDRIYPYNKKQKVDFFNLKFCGETMVKKAAIALTKGKAAIIEGILQADYQKDNETGKYHFYFYIMVTRFELVRANKVVVKDDDGPATDGMPIPDPSEIVIENSDYFDGEEDLILDLPHLKNDGEDE